jgi:DNA-binding Lrp family transcriptional regulator
MDRIDGSILRRLQKNSAASVSELAQDVGLSASACHRRIKMLEDDGVIEGYVARIDRAKLGLKIMVFVEIALTSQSQDALNAFEQAVLRYEDILECHLTTGDADYLLRIAARDVADYDSIHRNCLAKLPGVSSMHTSFILRSIKGTQEFPVRV